MRAAHIAGLLLAMAVALVAALAAARLFIPKPCLIPATRQALGQRVILESLREVRTAGARAVEVRLRIIEPKAKSMSGGIITLEDAQSGVALEAVPGGEIIGHDGWAEVVEQFSAPESTDRLRLSYDVHTYRGKRSQASFPFVSVSPSSLPITSKMGSATVTLKRVHVNEKMTREWIPWYSRNSYSVPKGGTYFGIEVVAQVPNDYITCMGNPDGLLRVGVGRSSYPSAMATYWKGSSRTNRTLYIYPPIQPAPKTFSFTACYGLPPKTATVTFDNVIVP